MGQNSRGHSAALIIALGAFRDARLGEFPDVQAIAKELGRSLSAAPHEFVVKTLLGRQATKDSVEFELDELALDTPSDRLLVVYMGNGLTIAHDDEEIGLLACYDSTLDNPETFITVEEVMSVRLLSGVRHVAFFIDAPITSGAMGLQTEPTLPEGIPASAARAHVALSGGSIPAGAAGYVSMVPELIEALHPLEFRDWEFMAVAKRIQRWLINRGPHPQVLQAGHLEGSFGGAFSFGAPPITPYWDPRQDRGEVDAPALTAEQEEAFTDADRRMKERFDKLAKQKRMLEDLHASLTNSDD